MRNFGVKNVIRANIFGTRHLWFCQFTMLFKTKTYDSSQAFTVAVYFWKTQKIRVRKQIGSLPNTKASG
jgi:hypothetical protein